MDGGTAAGTGDVFCRAEISILMASIAASTCASRYDGLFSPKPNSLHSAELPGKFSFVTSIGSPLNADRNSWKTFTETGERTRY
jgi:hypothetical protein